MIGLQIAGIIGFLRIVEHNEDEFATKYENYIEFDTEDLRNFHQYYFTYFFDKYNVAQGLEDRTKQSFEWLINNIESALEEKEKEKQRKEKVKTNKKYIKEAIKKQLDKIKKIDEKDYNEIKEQYDKIDKEETKEGIENIRNIIFSKIKQENINKRLTLNLFKSILSNTYYGQLSFLNVVKSALTYEEQENVMYKDYLSNIVEMGFIHNVMEGKYNLEEIEEYIKKAKDQYILTDEMKKVYEKMIKDYIQKGKTLEEIQKYLKEKVIKKCSLCDEENGLTSNYSEGNFVPLAMSSDNARNFFWNQNVKLPICDLCKLILFCIPAGVTTITKTFKENGEYKEKSLLSFVNIDSTVIELLQTNNHFADRSKYENRKDEPYSDLILDIVEQNKEISKWQLDNIFVVEFEAEYGGYSRIQYFNIPRYIIRFFIEDSEKTLSKISDYKYRLQIVDYILKNKDIKYVINDRLRDELKKEKTNGYNTLLATKIRTTLKVLKKEGKSMEDVRMNNNRLYVLYKLGNEIHEKLKRECTENKLNGYAYKMLNSIKAGNKREFMDMVIRLHISMEKEVSPIFLGVMQDSDLDFEAIGHSFLAGLISDKYEKKTNNDEIEGGN